MISRSQMRRQLYQNGGIMNVARENYGWGSSIKNRIRKIIPNEIADIAVKAAPFVAMIPGGAPYAAAMRGIGRFDQRGSISDAVKQAGATYALAKTVGGDGANIFNAPESVFGGEVQAGNVYDVRGLDDEFSSSVSFGKDSFVDNIISGVQTGVQTASDAVTGILNAGRQALATADMKTLESVLKGSAYLLKAGLSYYDQKRVNELREKIYNDYQSARAGKQAQYNPGTTNTVAKTSFNPEDVVRAPAMYGGRMGYAYGNSVQDGIMSAPQIADQMGMPVGNPRQNQQGVAELDYRDEGGFVPPIGIKEKEDDIPAMLSNNEFVFTAKAVREAGDGDVNEGARKMYTMMKQLENGGMA